MRFILALIILISVVLNYGCTEETIINNNFEQKTLVLISDMEQTDDLIIRIYGRLNKDFPDIKIDYIRTSTFNVRQASYILDVAVSSYPQDTYFAVIVEPTTDSKKILAHLNTNQRIMTANNGIISRLLKTRSISNAYNVENPTLFGGKPISEIDSDTYYLESIVALLAYTDYSVVGSKVDDLVVFQETEPKIEEGKVIGEIMFADAFGNGVTNIGKDFFAGFEQGEILRVRHGNQSFLVQYGMGYSSVGIGEDVVFFNSANLLQISTNYGNITSKHSIAIGEGISIEKAQVNIGLLLYNESAVVNDIVAGMYQQLSNLGIREGDNLNVYRKSAGGDNSKLNQLVLDILVNEIDIFVAVSTPASQAAVLLVPESIPVIFTYVTDPVSAGLLNRRKMVSGLSDATNFNDYFNFINSLIPNPQSLGTIYNANESNSVYAQEMLMQKSILAGVNLFQAIAENEAQVATAYNELTENSISALLIVADNTLSSAMPNLSQLAIADKIPLIGDSFQHCAEGALASISVDYNELAGSTANMVHSVLIGKNPDSIPYLSLPSNTIAINTQTESLIGFKIPDDIKQKAKFIFP